MIKAFIFCAAVLVISLLLMLIVALVERIKPKAIDFILFADIIIKRKRSQKKANNKVINISNYQRKRSYRNAS